MVVTEKQTILKKLSRSEDWYLSVIACPQCKGKLVLDGELLFCRKCQIAYPTEYGIPSLLLPTVRLALYEGRAPVKHYYFAEERYDWAKDPKALELAYHRWRKWQTWKQIENKLKPGQVVLDVGCGTGLITSPFVKRQQAVIALDLNPWALSKMDGKPTIFKVQGDGESLPIKDNSVDLVIITEMIEHLENPAAVAMEVFRICKKGAQVVGSVPSNSLVWKWRKYLSMTCGGGEPFHRNFDSDEIANLWKSVGFRAITRYSCLGLNWIWILNKT